MNIAVRYFTRSGNTKKLAEAVAGAAGVSAKDVSVPLDSRMDVLFLCSSVYAAGVDGAVAEFLKSNAKNIGMIVNVSTAAVLSSTYGQVKKLADECGIKISEEEFHCRGSFLFMHRGHPDDRDLQNAANFTLNILKNIL